MLKCFSGKKLKCKEYWITNYSLISHIHSLSYLAKKYTWILLGKNNILSCSSQKGACLLREPKTFLECCKLRPTFF